MPFVWMLSTSLKVQEKIQAAHLDLIPRASFIMRDGKPARVKPVGAKEGKVEVQVYNEKNEPGDTLRVDASELRDRFHLCTPNYVLVLARTEFGRYLLNTLTICLLTVTGTVLSCSLVAYGLACVEWRMREVLFWIMLSTMMLPGQVTMIPLFMTFKKLGWINSILPLVAPSFLGNAFFIFLLRQFYRSIPRDLVEAARIDGCSDLGIWARIMVPLSRPALAVVALFTFIGSWNDFLGPLIYLMEEKKYTLSIGLAMFQGQYGGEWGQMMAMSLMMTVPIIVIFFFTQKTFIQGVKLSGIKG
jgi:multiple sugar transport system permease protein